MTTRTDQSGNFTFTVKGGDTVIVYAEPANKRDFLAEYYSDKHSFDEADRIGISANVTGINFLLKHKPVLPNGISGTIQDTLGVGVASHIAVFRVVNNHVDKKYVTLSDSLGNYALGNILPGKYILKAVPTNNYRATYFKYDGTTTTFTVTNKIDSLVYTAINGLIEEDVEGFSITGDKEVTLTREPVAGSVIGICYFF